MISKQFRMTVALLALAVLVWVAASAGQVARKAEPLKIGKIVQLKAYYDFNGPKLKIHNLTCQPINEGTTINWSITGRRSGSASEVEMKGSFKLREVVWHNGYYIHQGGLPFLYEAKPKAWFVK